MSLYRFFETNINENPDLLLLNYQNTFSTNDLYSHFLNKQRRTVFQTFTDILVNQAISTAAKNPIQFELLRLKSRGLANRIEHNFNNRGANK